MPLIKGQCHCGNLSCQLVVPDSANHLTLYGCACGYCRLHACTWLGAPAEALLLSAEMADEAGWYGFSNLQPHYLFCRHCGVVVACVNHFGDDWFGVVNAQTTVLPPLPQDFLPFRQENLSEPERLARRRQRWVRGVQFQGGLQPPRTVRLAQVGGLTG